MKKNIVHLLARPYGFTLIELLVAIAIIGILTSIVLASLNVARGRGADAKVKAQIANARNAADLYFDSHGSYNGFAGDVSSDCATADSMFQDTASSMATYVDPNIYPSPTTIDLRCSSTEDTYVISGALSQAGKFWCIDSTGFSGEVDAADHTTAHPDDATACNP